MRRKTTDNVLSSASTGSVNSGNNTAATGAVGTAKSELYSVFLNYSVLCIDLDKSFTS